MAEVWSGDCRYCSGVIVVVLVMVVMVVVVVAVSVAVRVVVAADGSAGNSVVRDRN